MKKIFIKILTCILISLCAISSVSMFIPVNASGIEPYSYYDNSFSFKGTCSISKQCSGLFASVKVKATASNNNNETITLQIHVNNTGKTQTHVFYSDGQYHEYKNIYLGLSGGSGITCVFTGANPEITINTQMIITS